MSRRHNNDDNDTYNSPLRKLNPFARLGAIFAILIVALIVIGAIAATTTYSIGVSQDGILVNTFSGQITECNCPATTQFFAKSPWTNLVIIPTSVQTVTFQGNSTGIFVLSQDNLEIEFDINLRYQILANHAIDLFKKFPSQNWEQAAIEPHVRTAFRDIVAKYPADQIQIVRDAIQSGVETELGNSIANDSSLASAISVVSLQITDITLPQSFSQAIAAKLSAQQQLLQSQFDAEKTVVIAQGQANATIAQAEGVRNSQLIVANGTYSSLQLIAKELGLNQSQTAALTSSYVFMQQLQSLCQQTNQPCQNLILMLGGNNGQIFQIPIGSTNKSTSVAK